MRDEITPEWQNLELGTFLQDFVRRINKKLPSMTVTVEGAKALQVRSDPALLGAVLENLLLNAYEAKGEGSVVRIKIDRDDRAKQAVVEIIDNGPGIATELLPDVLFEPFKTSNEGG